MTRGRSRRRRRRTWSTISPGPRSRVKPDRAGRAERAAHRAAGLRREADGEPVAGGQADGLDGRAVGEVEQVLARAVGGVLALDERPGREARAGLRGSLAGRPAGRSSRRTSARLGRRASGRAAWPGSAARPSSASSAPSSARSRDLMPTLRRLARLPSRHYACSSSSSAAL